MSIYKFLLRFQKYLADRWMIVRFAYQKTHVLGKGYSAGRGKWFRFIGTAGAGGMIFSIFYACRRIVDNKGRDVL